MMARSLIGPAAIAAVLGAARGIAGEAAPVAPASAAPEPVLASSPYHAFMDGLNRLPRPLLALGTLGFFAFSMLDPVRFAERMAGLQAVPEPLWWLLGGIIGFYFGAREAHYIRARGQPAAPAEPNPAPDGWKTSAPD